MLLHVVNDETHEDRIIYHNSRVRGYSAPARLTLRTNDVNVYVLGYVRISRAPSHSPHTPSQRPLSDSVQFSSLNCHRYADETHLIPLLRPTSCLRG